MPQPITPEEMEKTFEQELSSLLNKYSLENESGTPDFILANYLKSCLEAYNVATNKRLDWYAEKFDPKTPNQ